MDINDRLEAFIIKKYKKQSNFCNATGIKPTTCSNWLNEDHSKRSKMSFGALSTILKKTQISAYWLLLGEGPMYLKVKNWEKIYKYKEIA